LFYGVGHDLLRIPLCDLGSRAMNRPWCVLETVDAEWWS
jgi:hypothetical protein